MLRRAHILTLLVLLAAVPALAQSSRTEVDQLNAQRRDKTIERDDLRAEAQTAAREAAELQARLSLLGRTEAAGEGRLTIERARFESLSAEEQALTLRMAANRGQASRLLSALQLYSRNPPPALLVSPRSANDAVNAAILMRAMMPELKRRAAAMQLEAESFNRVRRQTALAHTALFTTESQQADRRAEIERLIAEKTALKTRLETDAQAADLQAQGLAERIARLGGLVEALGPSTPSRVSGPALAAQLGGLRAPVRGALIRRFGEPGDGGGRSSGLTWRAEPMAAVTAPAAGRVEFAGPLKGWGQVVVIAVGGDWRVVLAGLDRISVEAGRSVAAGESVGVMGQARTPPPQLYMELRSNGQPVDPSRRLDAAARP
jgi:septal ring factor EnvC (AmiA/AmiB activator)